MKTVPFLKFVLLLIALSNFSVLAQNPPTPNLQNNGAAITNMAQPNASGSSDTQVNQTTKATAANTDNAKKTAPETPTCEKCIPQDSASVINIISFSPLLLFLFIFCFVFFRLKKDGYKIGDALKENESITVATENPLIANAPEGAAPAPFVDEKIQPKSSSRLIAFITGLVTLGLASSVCTFWLYTYLKCGSAPDLETVTNVFLSLGLGVVPYAFNRISNAIK